MDPPPAKCSHAPLPTGPLARPLSQSRLIGLHHQPLKSRKITHHPATNSSPSRAGHPFDYSRTRARNLRSTPRGRPASSITASGRGSWSHHRPPHDVGRDSRGTRRWRDPTQPAKWRDRQLHHQVHITTPHFVLREKFVTPAGRFRLRSSAIAQVSSPPLFKSSESSNVVLMTTQLLVRQSVASFY
jgi:hypothetical protein